MVNLRELIEIVNDLENAKERLHHVQHEHAIHNEAYDEKAYRRIREAIENACSILNALLSIEVRLSPVETTELGSP